MARISTVKTNRKKYEKALTPKTFKTSVHMTMAKFEGFISHIYNDNTLIRND